MRILVKTNNLEDYIYLPATEKELQKICDKFDIPNNMSASVTIQTDYDDNRLAKVLADKEVNLNELNFLTKKLVALDARYDLEVFYAVANTMHEPMLKDLINLSFNINCYHLITDFKDSNTHSRTLYLNEHSSASSDDLYNLDGYKYIDDIMKNCKILSASSNGLLYTNKNNPVEYYKGQVFPLHFHTTPLITANLAYADKREYLFLPCEETELAKALERLQVPSLDFLEVSVYKDKIPENIMKISRSNDFNELNNFANILENVGYSNLEFLSKLVEFLKVDNVDDLETVAKSMKELVIYFNIKNCEQLGFYEIVRSGKFEIDEDLEEYFDFEKYGNDKLESEKGIFTDIGYLHYMGFNKEMIEFLNRNLGTELEYESYSETLKLYMPLELTTYDEEDDYGRYHKTEYEGSISHTEFRGQGEELNELLQDYQGDYETDRKLMEYYSEADSINAKVKSLHFEIEERDRGLFGVAVAELNAPLNRGEISKLSDFALGQSSDGIGEGFEQQDYNIDGRDINIHLWQSDDNWYIKTAEEMGFKEPDQDIETNTQNLEGEILMTAEKRIDELYKKGNLAYAYIFPDRSGCWNERLTFNLSSENIANIIMANAYTADKVVITDMLDVLVCNSMFGGFLDQCPNQELCKDILSYLVPIQMGSSEVKEVLSATDEEINEYMMAEDKQECDASEFEMGGMQ